MTEQEKREKAIYKMVIDVYGNLFETLPSYYEVVKDIRSGRYSDLAKLYDTGYRKVDKDSVFHIDISEEFAKECKGEIEKAYKEGYTDGIEVPLKELREQMKDDILRKEEEVRKKTEAKLKRLLLVLCNKRHNYYPSIDSYCVSEKVVKLDDIKEQFKKFGVEVEE